MDRKMSGVQGLWVHSFLPVLFATLVLVASPAQGVDRIIGGAIYTDLANPLTSGLAGVTVTVTGTGDTTGTFNATTAGAQGLWQMTIPEGTYTVTPSMTGKVFEHVVGGVPDGQSSLGITVNQANLAANQSIQFRAQDLVNETIGGAVYTDLDNPLTSGLAGVTVTVSGEGGTFQAATSGAQGLWQIADVPPGTYTVTPSMGGYRFEHVVQGAVDGQASIQITVNQANRAANQSIQFQGIIVPPETIGGAIYNDLKNPLTTGEIGVTVTVTGPGGTFQATTSGAQGLWEIANVPVSAEPYTVTPAKAGRRFEHVVQGAVDGQASIQITVNQANRAANQSIQFKAFPDLPASKLAFTAQPASSYPAGAQINAVPEVAVQDAEGHTITSSTASITIALGQNPGSGTLSGTLTRQAVNGVASFPGLSINKTGVGYTLVASSTGLTSATSNAFSITPGDPAKLGILTQPGNGTAGAALSPAPQVGIYDALDNLATTATNPVTAALSGGPADAALLGSSTVTVNGVNGVATFSNLKVDRQGTGYQLTFTSPGLTSSPASQAFSVSGAVNLVIAKVDGADPVDPNTQVTYTITYGNTGTANATNTVIVETLPAGLVHVSSTGGGVYNAAARTITWTIGTLNALTTDQTVSFVAKVGGSMPGGGVVTNNNLTIDCAETEPVLAASETTTVNDKAGPTITPIVPDPNQVVAIDSIVKLRIADSNGVAYGDGTVTIHIGTSLIYDGANETDPNRYDSRLLDQRIKGVCRRTGSATAYTFTFLPSVPYGFDKRLMVTVHASDRAGNTTDESYLFETQPRVFGPNTRVNSDTGTLVQDNPATVVRSEGNIWVAWDQTNAAGNTDIYVALLAAGDNAFGASAPVASTDRNERNPAVAVDANDVLYVAWEQEDPDTGWDVLVRSYDGTAWSDPVRVAQEDPNDPGDQTAPSIAVDMGVQPNAIYVAWEDTRSGNKDVWLASSTDGAATWEEVQITTNAASQTQPAVVVDEDHVVYVVWTDARNAATTGTDLYGTSSEESSWENLALVNAAGDQSTPVGVTSDNVHLLWVSDANDILYVNDAGDTLPFVGASIIDPNEPGTRGGPALAAGNAYGATTLFAAWHDGRDAASGDAGDIYFAESGSPFGTNVLVNDDVGTARQMKPAIGIDGDGNPYLVWVDNRRGNDDIFYAGSIAIEPPPATTVETDPDTGISTVSTADPNLPTVEVPPDVLPEGVEVTDITIQRVSNIPDLPPEGGFGLCYGFGPSGTVFLEPVTVRIPLADDDPTYTTYNVYRYDPGTLSWTTEGIHNPARKVTTATGTYLEVQVDHFSVFAAGGLTGVTRRHGGGGCALTPWGSGSPIGFAVPFVGYVFILLIVTMIDRVRRRSSGTRG